MVLDEELKPAIQRPPTPPDTDRVRKNYTFLCEDPFSNTTVPGNNAVSNKSSHHRSLSASSIVEPIGFLSNGKVAANFEFHNEYKERSLQTTRKLHRFFGEKPPIDVCVREIERQGLRAILHSKLPLCYFLLFLLEEYSSENLVSLRCFPSLIEFN
jgi:hypothetical protein